MDGRSWHERPMRILTCIVGLLVLAVGAALLVLPGPGIPIVLVGLTMLAPHFEWARRLGQWARARLPWHARRREKTDYMDGDGRNLRGRGLGPRPDATAGQSAER